jgi:hypothetical protein
MYILRATKHDHVNSEVSNYWTRVLTIGHGQSIALNIFLGLSIFYALVHILIIGFDNTKKDYVTLVINTILPKNKQVIFLLLQNSYVASSLFPFLCILC